jgi:SAM-dependent methyltransferase
VIRLIQKFKPSGRFLDVGCATGAMLVAAKDSGFETEGLELSDWSSKLAMGKGLVVHKEYLESLASKKPGQYDVISLIGVIEHFADPLKELKYIRSLLKPDGILVVWTGDVDSITSRFLGRKWWYWQGQHIQYFTHRSLITLSDRAGIKHVKTKLYPFGATQETLSNSLKRYRFHKALTWAIKPAFALKPVWHLRLPGEMLFIGRAV